MQVTEQLSSKEERYDSIGPFYAAEGEKGYVFRT